MGRRRLCSTTWAESFALAGLLVFCAMASVGFAGDGVTEPSDTPVAAEAEQLLDAAREAFAEGRFKRAAKRYREADELAGGRSWEAIAGLTATSIELAWFDQAEEHARRLLELEQSREQLGLAHHLLGEALAGRGRLDEAEIELLKALGLRSGRPHHTLRALASVLCRQGREGEGLQLLDEAGLCAGLPRPDEPGTDVQGSLRLDEGAGVSPPRKLSGPSPHYPQELHGTRIEGQIVLDTVIDASGQVQCVSVVKGSVPEISCAAAVAVFDWIFQPARRDGQPIESAYTVTVRFDMD